MLDFRSDKKKDQAVSTSIQGFEIPPIYGNTKNV